MKCLPNDYIQRMVIFTFDTSSIVFSKYCFIDSKIFQIIAYFKIGTRKFQAPGVGVTKAPFVNFSVSKIFDPTKVPVRFF